MVQLILYMEVTTGSGWSRTVVKTGKCKVFLSAWTLSSHSFKSGQFAIKNYLQQCFSLVLNNNYC